MPVTTDHLVATQMAKRKKAASASEVAAMLELTPFQITARLKGMEKRGLVFREKGLWLLTDDGRILAGGPPPPPPPPRETRRNSGPPQGGLPDDSGVPVYEGKMPRMRYLYDGHRRISIFIAADGVEWVEASAFEKADALYYLPPFDCHMRLKLRVESKKVKRAEKNIQREERRREAKSA